jgi:hypothetical protein
MLHLLIYANRSGERGTDKIAVFSNKNKLNINNNKETISNSTISKWVRAK